MTELDPRALEAAAITIACRHVACGSRKIGNNARLRCIHGNPGCSCMGDAGAAIRTYLNEIAAVSKKEKESPNLPSGHVSIPIVKPEDVKGEKE